MARAASKACGRGLWSLFKRSRTTAKFSMLGDPLTTIAMGPPHLDSRQRIPGDLSGLLPVKAGHQFIVQSPDSCDREEIR